MNYKYLQKKRTAKEEERKIDRENIKRKYRGKKRSR